VTQPPPTLHRNHFAVWAACFIGFAGFTLVMPFLPLYFGLLGVTDTGRIALWAGLSLGITPGMTALLGPVWGRLADRFGRKVMVERSLVSFVIVMTLLAFVTAPWQVLALRGLQGFFAGYGTIAVAMVAESVPKARMAAAIGNVQTAQRLGLALGPVMGGVLAQMVGLRNAFLVSAGFYAAGFLLILLLYEERHVRPAAVPARGGRVTFRNILAFQHFLLLMAVAFGVHFVERSFGPVLPLFVAQTGTSAERVALVSGMLFSLAAGAAAIGHGLCKHLLARWSARAVIAGSAGAGALALVLFAATPHTGLLFVGMPVFGTAMGTGMTATWTAAGRVIPAGAHATGFGVLSSAALIAVAVSPIFGGFLAATSIRAVFLLGAVALGILAAVVLRVMVTQPTRTEQPIVEDA
jgi:MFS transporter, DHA1 family, multidrug resistance protein